MAGEERASGSPEAFSISLFSILVRMSESLTSSIRLLRTIADETRLKILLILSRAEFTVGEMVQILGIHQSNTSRHLTQLRESQLVALTKEGADLGAVLKYNLTLEGD